MKAEETADGIGLTHGEIARRLGISRTRVHQIEAQALRKMAKRAKLLGLTLDGAPSRARR
jgi:DNA-directed RNA polymerase sigma subunit (sigma70/sigma32)